jgi:hypothetical protein
LDLLTERHARQIARRTGYQYYLTVLVKQAVAAGIKLKQLVIVPELAALPCR